MRTNKRTNFHFSHVIFTFNLYALEFMTDRQREGAERPTDADSTCV